MGPLPMARLQCPRCGTVIDERPGQAPVCPECGFQGEPPSRETTPEAPFAPAPSTAPYGGPPGGGYGAGDPYSAPQPLGPPTQGAPAYDQRPTNGMAVASLVLSLVGLCTGITAILGIIFGIVGRNQCREKNEKGEGMAIAGIIIGAVIVGLGVLYVLFMMIMFGMMI